MRARVILAVLLIAGAGLRLHHLAAESLWLDEAFSITISRLGPGRIVEMTAQDVHPPLYYFLLYAWTGLWGSTEWDARLLSVMFSLGLVAAACALGARIFDRRAGLIAAGLLAIAPFQIEFAQEARMYALLALLATLSTLCLLGQYRATAPAGTALPARSAPADGPTGFGIGTGGLMAGAGWLIAYVVITSMMTYTHVHSLFVLAAHAAVVGVDLIRRRSRALPFVTRWAGAQAAVAVAFLPWMAIFIGQVSHVQSGFWIPEPGWSAVPAALAVYAGSARLTWLLAPLAGLGLWRSWRGQDSMGGRMLLAWLTCSLGLPFAVSLAGSSIFLPKYTIAASVPFAILAAGGLSALPRLVRIGAVVAVVVLTAQALQPYYYGRARKDDWRGAVRQIEAKAQPGDVIVFYPFFTKIPYDMYQAREDVVRVPFPRGAEAAADPALIAMIDPLVGDAERVWLVTMSFDPRKPLLLDALSDRLTAVDGVSAFHVDAHLFTAP